MFSKSTMRIVNARWTREYNMLAIECSCGCTFEQRGDRWWVRCPTCGNSVHLNDLRERYRDGDWGDAV